MSEDYPLSHPGVLEAEGLKILEGIQDVELDATQVDLLFKIPHPLQASEAQRAVIVEALRRSRKTYSAKKAAKQAKKAAKPLIEIEGFSLEDLDIKAEDILK
jgi:hypothetical protein